MNQMTAHEPIMDLLDNPESDTLLSAAQVARVLSVSTKTVTRWQKAGKIRAVYTPGGHRRYRRSDLNSMLRLANSDNLGGGPAAEMFTEEITQVVAKPLSEIQKIRAWARKVGYDIGERGRIPGDIRAAYEKALQVAETLTPSAADVRAWARDNNITVPPKGPVDRRLVEQYKEAHHPDTLAGVR